MATSSEDMNNDLTFRRYEDGDSKTSAWSEQIFQASWSHKCPTYVHRTPPCQGSCPAGEDIRGWLDIVRGIEKPVGDMDWQEYAFRRSTNANPFPSIMGRVCPAPCQDGCNRNQVEDFVGINSIEQYIGDTALANNYQFDAPAPETGKKVAIIGGGPAGLAAAYQLRRRGHGATVFDDHEELGGFMRYGIPGYRTPRDVLDGEIKRITDMGVEVRTSTRIGKDIPMDQIEKDYDAVLWAIGTHSGRNIPVEGADAVNCISGIAFLAAFNEGRLQAVTGKVIVIGGGDTSIDVASVARRLGAITEVHENDRAENVILGQTAHDVAATAKREGADVMLTSLFPVEEMTAAEHEVRDATNEGVEIRGSVMPLEVIKGADGRATALKIAKCEMVDGRPTVIEGSEETIECDLVVSAIGQSGNMEGIESVDNGKGFIDADANFQVPGKAGHFVAGDIVRPHLLTTAIGQASIAADGIDRYLDNQEMSKRPKVDVHHFNLMRKLVETDHSPVDFHAAGRDEIKKAEGFAKEIDLGLRGTSENDWAVHNYEDRATNEIIPSTNLFLGHFEFTDRIKRDEISIGSDEVLGNYQERLVCLTTEQAQEEAGRCMSCGMCFECDNCVVFCPQEAVKKTPAKDSTTGRYVFTDYSRCIGCHICADVCPTGYIDMGMGE
ncbi:glutamate synthase [Solemya pervernicosa gill symbiont]|uniref:Glutamate synthase n=2 Tax=Gammaproteobacteria incertae sedis TaxID=118884 RepID=A0A1T2L6L9_9GAMM|nr:NAD(P)-binding protein [Candidatus Reidiella endopervernicosa]OOZ40694.1 glutamate synthase [Solemya pervernicosa gill symbiont]QKQ26758.1 NAD(P)-binding protein [Candidatus Reidiella endopervernicosa]